MNIFTAIIGIVAGSIVLPIGRHVRYLQYSKSSIVNLKNQLDELIACREQVRRKVDEADEKGERIEIDVERWLRSVADIIEEANKLLEHERNAETRCLQGFCPNLILRYEFGKKSTKLVQATAELYEKRNFPSISYNVSTKEVLVIPNHDYEAFDSRISTLKKIIVELRNPTTNRIGLYGIGGVGKTTLVQELYRNVITQNSFEDVVFVYGVRIPDLERIQKVIAQKLGMNNRENETRYGRARRLCDRMKSRKTLVILDDVQSIDLEAVGIPNVATCKVLLISRSREVFSSYRMRTQRDLKLDVLDGEETWRLFEKTAGDVVKDPTIRPVAMQIARKCGGLPIYVVTVASYLKESTSLARWRDALRRVMHYDVDDELSERVYSSLQWSYNQLDEELKSLFLLCGANAWRNHISLDDLLKYSMGLGRLKKLSTTKARNALHSMVERLKDCCLLVDGNNNDLVKIDDFLRDFAIEVALRGQHILSVAYGDELPEWPNEDFLQRCTMISLPCCNIPRLPTVLESPKVQLFHFWSNNNSLDMSCSFFEKMKELKVLDLTNLHIPSLPSSLQFITNLQTLCLHECDLKDIALIGQLQSLEILSFVRSKVTHLPKELQQLSCLRVLDLTDCTELVVIFPNVISSLKRLEDLRMKNSFKQWEAEGGLGERKNARLSELKYLSQLITLAIHIQDADFLPEGLFSNRKLDKYQILIGDEWKWEDVDESVNRLLKLKLTASHRLDHQGLQMLLKTSDSLHLDALESFRTWKLDGEDFQLKHLVVQNYAEITYLMNEKVSSRVIGLCCST